MPSPISAVTTQLLKLLAVIAACLFIASVNRAQNPESTKSKDAALRKLVATIGGQPVYEDDLSPHMATKLMQLRHQEYQIKKQALDNLIDEKVIQAEAKKKGVSTDKLLEQEVDAKVVDPTEAEVYAFFLGQRNQQARFDDMKAQLKTSLKQAKIQQARRDFYVQLWKQSQVAVLLQAPKVDVSYDPARVRGNPKASVMIVEFADFQCPYCRAVEPTLKSVLSKHEDQVAIAFRDMPVTEIHPLAQGAARIGDTAFAPGYLAGCAPGPRNR